MGQLAVEMFKRESILKDFVPASKSASGTRGAQGRRRGMGRYRFQGAEALLPGGLHDTFSPLMENTAAQSRGSVTCLMRYRLMRTVNLTTIGFDAI